MRVFIAGLFGYLMNFIYNLVQNYGLAIILFTLLVKILMLPLSIKQQKSLEKAQKMQSIMKDLQAKYGKNQEQMLIEYQKIMKENKMSLMESTGCSGCLLNFIQIPIIIGMFYMLMSPLTHIMKMDSEQILAYKQEIVENRKNEAIELLVSNSGDELTKEALDAEIAKINASEDNVFIDARYYEIDVIKENNIMNLNFLGINLGDVASRDKENKILLIIPLLTALLTAATVVLNNAINKKKGIVTPKPEDSEIPMPDMRVINIMMPLMIGSIAYSTPQGLGLYWATGNLIGIIQTYLQRVVFDKDEKIENKNDTENAEIKDVNYEVVEDEPAIKEESKTNEVIKDKKSNTKKGQGKKKRKK